MKPSKAKEHVQLKTKILGKANTNKAINKLSFQRSLENS